jgi:glycosyltransferase involved in cell wall biosynthesis
MNKLPIISVLMCTYNGEKYIIEQLESIRRQVYQPDNVLIYDDCSEDLTVNIINNYISKYNLSSVWKVSINSVRKGWRINFFDALLKCNDDFIFFCDQDDIWNPDKISLCMKIMHENPNVLLVNGLFELIDSSGNPIKNHNWTRNNVYNQKLIKVNLLDTMYFWKHRKEYILALTGITHS